MHISCTSFTEKHSEAFQSVFSSNGASTKVSQHIARTRHSQAQTKMFIENRLFSFFLPLWQWEMWKYDKKIQSTKWNCSWQVACMSIVFVWIKSLRQSLSLWKTDLVEDSSLSS